MDFCYLYVYKVSNLDAQHSNEMFTLNLVSREGLTNETSRCQTIYRGNLQTTVTKILKDDLKTKKYKSENIEGTSNDYSFIGNNSGNYFDLIIEVKDELVNDIYECLSFKCEDEGIHKNENILIDKSDYPF